MIALAGCGQTSGSASQEPKPARHAQLSPTGQSPLTVKGTGFRPGERVQLVLKGTHTAPVDTVAGANGNFVATFHELGGCDSVTVAATGAKGSRASFNLSQIACIEP